MVRIDVRLILHFLFLISRVFGKSNGSLAADDPIVEITQGQVQGMVWYTPEGRSYNAFLGVPFGQAPVGDLRYRPPLPAGPWEGIYQAKTDPIPCIQPSFTVPMSAIGAEDCLLLSIYTPLLPSEDTNPALPVQVYIHGGAYFVGDISPEDYGPQRYMNSDMVLVLMNYRVSALGFLSTGDGAANGNYGLLDQNLALQWVRDNIAAFGGDPSNVTLSGQSAGSASVTTHLLSPMSAGLFHRAIAESGSPLCAWALEEDPLPFAQLLGEEFLCPTDDTYALVDCLRQQDAGELQVKSFDVMLKNLTLAFVPVVENASTGGLFLTEDPFTLYEEGRFNQVPLLMGFNRDEGVLLYEWVFHLMEDVDDHFFDEVIPLFLRVLTDYRENLIDISYAIKEEYYDGIDLTNTTAVDITNINLISDMFMKAGIVQTIELVSSHNVPVHMYSFNYVSSTALTNFTGEPDVSHGAELKYLFYQMLSEKDSAWDPQMLNLWTNFILHDGDPSYTGSIQWDTTPPGQSTYLEINDEFVMVDTYDPEKMNFWLNVVPTIAAG